MAVDPRIAMGFQAPQIASPMDLAQNAFALKGAMQQNALAEAKMAEMQRQQQSQNALRQLFAGGKMPDAASVYAVDPTAGAEFEQRRAEIGRATAAAAASEAERAGSQYKNESAKFSDLLNLISGAKRDPRLYKINIALAKQRGFDVSQVPLEYDENWVNAAEQAVLSVKDRFDIEDKAAGRTHAGKTLDETIRHNRATEGIQSQTEARLGAGAGAPKPKDATVSEQQAAYHGKRILDAAAQIAAATKTTPSANRPSALEATVSATPGVRGLVGGVRSAPRQIVTAAQREMLDALLYMATGAAYNKEQLEGEIESTLPFYLDKPETVKAKRDRLRLKIDAAKIRAGSAWTPEMDAALAVLDADAAASGAAPAATSDGANIDALLDKYKDKP